MLVSNDGHALLTDFGFSHLSEASFSLAVEQRQGGTLNWMAPEYLEMNEPKMTTAGDVWAFGMTALASRLIALPLAASNSIFPGVVYQAASIRSSERGCCNVSHYMERSKASRLRRFLFSHDG